MNLIDLREFNFEMDKINSFEDNEFILVIQNVKKEFIKDIFINIILKITILTE